MPRQLQRGGDGIARLTVYGQTPWGRQPPLASQGSPPESRPQIEHLAKCLSRQVVDVQEWASTVDCVTAGQVRCLRDQRRRRNHTLRYARMNATNMTKTCKARQTFRFIVASLCGIGGYLSVSAQSLEPSWASTENGPSDVLVIGWGTVSLPGGLILGVGNAKDGLSSVGFLYHADTNRWSATESVSGVLGLGGSLTALPNGKVLAFGSTPGDRRTKAMAFDPATNHWRDAGQVPPDLAGYGRRVVPLSSGRVLVLSDWASRNGWVYDADKETWLATSDLPGETSGVVFAMALDGGNVFAIFKDTSPIERWVVMMYDSTQNVWRVGKPPPTTMRSTPNGVTKLPDGSILLIGFQQYPSVAIVPIIFHPDALTWSSAGSLPPLSSDVRGARLLPNGKVLVLSTIGFGKMRGILFDPARLSWTADSALPDGLLGAAIVGFLKDGNLWAMGYRNNLQRDHIVYSPTLSVWKSVRPMPLGTVQWSPSGNPDGSVLLFLGLGRVDASTIDDAVIYRP